MTKGAPLGLSHWTEAELQRFLEIRQEFFLDPMGSNKDRFLEAVITVQRALFDWYLLPPGKFQGAMALVKESMAAWSELRKEERRTLGFRRFALNNAAPDIPAVESSVSENQWQKIFGSLGLGLGEPGTFDRFLVQLDEETNPSLHMNHRFMGELGPHDNMISYVSSIVATFLNENAIIGKVSPCVTHMEQAAIRWLLALVGWDGAVSAAERETHVPAPRLPTPILPAERFLRWEREEPTGTIVVGGTIANISALLIARNAVFDYLLGWPGAVQWLGPMLAWDLVRSIWSKDRLVVLTSKGAHYSVKKAALQAGVAPGNIFEIAGSRNPWILDGKALERKLAAVEDSAVVIAVVAIAGKTETGYVDRIDEIAGVLNRAAETGAKTALPPLAEVGRRLRGKVQEIKDAIDQKLHSKGAALDSFEAARKAWDESDGMDLLVERIESGNEMAGACHNRLFLHVDAAHGGAYLTVPELRNHAFRGVELADTITIDGHKSFYCYYPCGGLLVRTTRWAQTLSAGQTAYISEDDNRGVYREGLLFAHAMESGRGLSVGDPFDGNPDYREHPATRMDERDLAKLAAIYQITRRPIAADRSELTHQPFNQYLEGSRGSQGIMQWYFNLATLGLRGYQSILGWTALLRARAEEAISLGMSDTRLVTDPPMPADLYAVDKQAAIQSAGASGVSFEDMRPPEALPGRAVLPWTGGRFLRLSAGQCNQLLMTYVPAREAKLIATASRDYWKTRGDVVRLMRYLWRVNQHLWTEHIYANPHFTYYLGHTALPLELPSVEDGESAAGLLAEILTEWNAWARKRGKDDQSEVNPFFEVLAEHIEETRRGSEEEGERKLYAWKFFCHKLIVMHPYTDESLIGDMLRRVAFYGERSVIDVRVADATARFLFPDKPTE